MTLDDIIAIAEGDVDVRLVDYDGRYLETVSLRYKEGYVQDFLDDFGTYSIEAIWGDFDRDEYVHEIDRVYLAVTISVETEDKK